MHQQIRTSPGDVGENLRRVLDALVAVNIEGIGNDFEYPHIRTVVTHEDWNAAWQALKAAGLQPEARRAVLVTIPHQSGKLRQAVENLTRRGYIIESIVTLGTVGQGDVVRVSIGIREGIEEGWEAASETLAEEITAGGSSS
jgi:hypothetical protein